MCRNSPTSTRVQLASGLPAEQRLFITMTAVPLKGRDALVEVAQHQKFVVARIRHGATASYEFLNRRSEEASSRAAPLKQSVLPRVLKRRATLRCSGSRVCPMLMREVTERLNEKSGKTQICQVFLCTTCCGVHSPETACGSDSKQYGRINKSTKLKTS